MTTDTENSRFLLRSQLEEYAARDLYPFHMPGHKRRAAPVPGLPYAWDVTELDGTDDLHDARGILREAMERTAALCGADRTWYLVNGSTCGLLAGIRALAPRGSEVLCARNCHKAVYHALELSGFRVHWILPPVEGSWGICGGISAGQIRKALRRHPSAKAVILTSPTYEGILSEVGEICGVCHEKGIPVLVDEAHGAHLLPMAEETGFPAGALACGADVVVQSPHKTLPSLTQTAWLHLQGTLVEADRIEEELDIFETSSPSYPLMASLDGCTGFLRQEGAALFDQWALRIGRFETRILPLRKLRVFGRGDGGAFPAETEALAGGFHRYDPGKILIDARRAGLDGPGLAALLRRDWGLETEMAQGTLVLAMTSPCDDEDALDRLAEALLSIDRAARTGERTGHDSQNRSPDESRNDRQNDTQNARSAKMSPAGTGSFYEGNTLFEDGTALLAASLRPAAACTLAEAAGRASERVPFSCAAGRICAEYLYFYPPGIPVLAPGELITDRHLDLLEPARRGGAALYRHASLDMIRCLRE